MKRTKTIVTESVKRSRPALTPEARENQIIAAAMDLVEERILNGTASSQEVTYFLKLGSTKEKLEKEKLQLENELTKAKTESINAQKRMDESLQKAISAFATYSGNKSNLQDEENEDDESIW